MSTYAARGLVVCTAGDPLPRRRRLAAARPERSARQDSRCAAVRDRRAAGGLDGATTQRRNDATTQRRNDATTQRRNDAAMRHCHATRAVAEADGCVRDDATVVSDVPFVRTRRRLRAYLGVAVTEAPCPLLRSAVPHVEFALHRLSSGWLRTRRGGSCPSTTQDDPPAKQVSAHCLRRRQPWRDVRAKDASNQIMREEGGLSGRQVHRHGRLVFCQTRATAVKTPRGAVVHGLTPLGVRVRSFNGRFAQKNLKLPIQLH